MLALLPARHPNVARYVARELEQVLPSFDSERVALALELLSQAPEPAVAAQGALALQRFHPLHLERYYEPPPEPVARQGGAPRAGKLLRQAAEDPRAPANLEAIARSSTHLLTPVVEALAVLVPRLHEKARQQALRVLARVPHGTAAELAFLTLQKEGSSAGPMTLLACAHHCRPRQGMELVRGVARLKDTPLHSAGVLCLGLAPYQMVFDHLVTLAREASPELLPSVAAALEGFPEFGPGAALKTIAERGSGWSLVQVLQTVGRLRDESGLELLRVLCRQHDHPAVHDAAARAAGGIGGERARRFLVEMLSRKPRPGVAARALQALQTTAASPDTLARAAASYLDSDDPEAAAAAVIASLLAEEAAALRTLKRLVLSSDPALRVHGAHCLGHHQGPSSINILRRLASRDPSPAVQRQAVASLGLYEPSEPVRDALLEVLAHGSPELRPLAARLLGRRAQAGDETITQALIAAADSAATPAAAGPLLTALGRLEHRSAWVYLSDQLRTRREPEALLGILDAFDLRAAPAPAAVTEMTASSDARVRGAAARVLWNQGETAAARVLCKLLADVNSPDAFNSAMRALETIATVSVKLAGLTRFEALRKKISANLDTAGYVDFAASELSLDIPREAPSPAYDPDEASLDHSSWHEHDVAGLLAAEAEMAGEGTPEAGAPSAGSPEFPSAGLDSLPASPRWGRLALAAAGALLLALVLGVLASAMR